MKKNVRKLIVRSISAFLGTVMFFSCFPQNVYAENSNIDPVIMVSLGDSYSSGEGIEPFYGQDKEISEKVKDKNWLAHRSQASWPGLLEIPGLEGTMKDYNVEQSTSLEAKWYFNASSGAETKHFNKEKQLKKVKRMGLDWGKEKEYYLDKQLDIFKDIDGTVDYVTLSIGGNDVNFSDIIQDCVMKSTYLGSNSLEKRIKKLWDEFDTTRSNIKEVYCDIQNAAGAQAEIIVAGYPKLLDKNGKGKAISKKEATIVNDNVSKFNDKLEEIINECSENGMNIHFVDVETEFDKDGGHQAYSENAWINDVMIIPKDQDLTFMPPSAYSIHPNASGAEAYARCVNEKIQEIESNKKVGTLFGKICKATDRVSPVSEANISVYKNDRLYTSAKTDQAGNYCMTLPIGDYRVEISASGYINFTAYATVNENYNTYMETFLLVEGAEGETGTATGQINNALTGNGVEGVSLSVRKGWNNSQHGDIVASTVTSSNGEYTLTLPIGNYTVTTEKEGYVSATINIIVQPEITDSQNGTITPNLSGNNYRIVLTWGSNPRDLDSHMEGSLSDGNPFHVYYLQKSSYDGKIQVCNLDVDDTTSYGPETVTLNATTNKPYYYYIYHYAGSGSLATSEAQIKIYQGESLVGKFNVPTDLGNNRYWNVFAIVDGQIIVKNTITSSPDVSYIPDTKSSIMMLDFDDTGETQD